MPRAALDLRSPSPAISAIGDESTWLFKKVRVIIEAAWRRLGPRVWRGSALQQALRDLLVAGASGLGEN